MGLLGGFGLVLLVFGFHLPPGKPPVGVMPTIVAAVAASATLQASGGLEVMPQAAAVSAMVPVALSIGVPPGYSVAFAAASCGYFLPTYPGDLATIQFDRPGTTRIGKYVINHSFILPGADRRRHVVPGGAGAGFGARFDPRRERELAAAALAERAGLC